MKRWTAGAKTIAVSAAGLLVTAGLCKLGQFEDSTHHDGAPGWFDILGRVGPRRFLAFVVCWRGCGCD